MCWTRVALKWDKSDPKVQEQNQRSESVHTCRNKTFRVNFKFIHTDHKTEHVWKRRKIKKEETFYGRLGRIGSRDTHQHHLTAHDPGAMDGTDVRTKIVACRLQRSVSMVFLRSGAMVRVVSRVYSVVVSWFRTEDRLDAPISRWLERRRSHRDPRPPLQRSRSLLRCWKVNLLD